MSDFDLLGAIPYEEGIIESDLSGSEPFADGKFPEPLLQIFERVQKYAIKD